jgi:DNA-binding LytR/AlgR family response regulator
MINCIIIDDEQHAIEVLAHYIGQTGALRLAASSDDPLQAIQLLNGHKIDLIFLDIHMPQLSGLQLAKVIDKRYKVVLCTAYPDYALEGFELDVLDYLVKPIPIERFLRTVQKAIDHFGHSIPNADPGNDFIMVKTGVKGKLIKIDLRDICYIEGMKNYVSIHHGVEKTLSLISMKEMEEKLPAGLFMRVHKSFIVAIPRITAVEGNEIILKSCHGRVLLGEAYRQKFLDSIKEKVIGRT